MPCDGDDVSVLVHADVEEVELQAPLADAVAFATVQAYRRRLIALQVSSSARQATGPNSSRLRSRL